MANKRKRSADEPRDPNAPLHTRLDCKPDVCELARDGDYDPRVEGMDPVPRYACGRCGYSTTDGDEAKRLNPDIAGATE